MSIYDSLIQMQKKSSIVQFMRHGPPARDGIPSLHSDGEALPKVACLSCVTSDDGDTPAELGDKEKSIKRTKKIIKVSE